MPHPRRRADPGGTGTEALLAHRHDWIPSLPKIAEPTHVPWPPQTAPGVAPAQVDDETVES
jgi:hypothetical protein